MQAIQIQRHEWSNALHTFALVGLMLGLVGLLGWLLGGASGLLWAGAFGLGLLVFGRSASPGFLLRLLNAHPIRPEEAPWLSEMTGRIARRAGLPRAPRLFLASQPFPNAFALGSREDPVIGITTGLLQRLETRDIANILAHEISHIRHNDTRVMSLAAYLTQATRVFAFFGQVLLFINLPLLMVGRTGISWLAVLLLLFAPTLSGLLQLALSRTREFDADLGAVRILGDPAGMAAALVKLEQLNVQTHWGLPYRVLNPGTPLSTHPSTRDRVHRLRDIAAGSQPPVRGPGDFQPFIPNH